LFMFLDPGRVKIRIRDKHPGCGEINFMHPGFKKAQNPDPQHFSRS
jgi:hypothetical protein